MCRVPTPEERAANIRELRKLHPSNRFRLMFGQPPLPEPSNKPMRPTEAQKKIQDRQMSNDKRTALRWIKSEFPDLLKISELLNTQDNRCTSHPMFCVQKLTVDCGFDGDYFDQHCWYSPEDMEWQYDDKPSGDGWEGPYGYKLRWETVMIAFTEQACEEYLDLNGHNVCRVAHKGQVRIYADTFWRCTEMINLREFLLDLSKK